MLVKPPLEKLLPKVENRYTLAILVAKRARQLVDGALALMPSESPNYVSVACFELASNRISCVHGQVNPYIPLRPEIEAARLAAKHAAAQADMADAVKEELEKAVHLAAEPADESDVSLLSEMLMKNDNEPDDIDQQYDEASETADAADEAGADPAALADNADDLVDSSDEAVREPVEGPEDED